MKNLILYFCWFTIGLVLFSCGKDDPAPDTEKPVITVLAPTDVAKPLRATVSVKAEAKDNTGIKKVEVFVDGTLLISATSSPVEASWDTKTVTDGAHQIKIVAEDIDGNKEELIFSVEVKNILFTFKIGSTYLGELFTGWIFITDDAGGLISNQEIKNGQTIVVETPEGYTNDKTFTYNKMEYLLTNFGLGTLKSIQLTSYTKLSSGDVILDRKIAIDRPEIGTHDLFITGIPPGQYQNRGVQSLDAQVTGYVGLTPNGAPVRASLFKSPTKVVYYMKENSGEVPLKYEVSAAASGGSLEVDFTSFTPFDSFVIPIPGAVSSRFGLSYVRTPGDYRNTVYGLSNQQNTNAEQLIVFYPNLNPGEYITSLNYTTNLNEEFSYTLVGNQMPTTFKKLEAELTSITSTVTTVSVDASGDFQTIFINSGDDTEINNNVEIFNWNFYMDKDFKSNITVPPIPESIKKLYPELATHSFVFDFVSLQKYAGVKNYNDWAKLQLSNSDLLGISKENFSRSKFFTPGGRVGGMRERSLRRGDPQERNLYTNIN